MDSKAMISLEQEIEGLKNHLKVIQSKDMTKLGDGSVFWITEAGKEKRGFKAKVDLTYPTQFCFPAGAKAKAMITGEGFDKLNQYAGIEVFQPTAPVFEKDKNGAITSITMTGIGIGYGPTGNLNAVKQTIYLNLDTLLVQEIQAKMKKRPSIAMLGVADQKPEKIIYREVTGDYRNKVIGDIIEKDAVGVWHFIPMTGNVGYWIDLSHPEIQDCYASFSQKQRFLERTTFTILKRLILSSHPAIATKTPTITSKTEGGYGKVTDAEAYVIVYGFKEDTGDGKKKREDLKAVVEKLSKGVSISDMEVIDNEPVDVASEAEVSDATIVADPTELPPVEEEEVYAPVSETPTALDDSAKSAMRKSEAPAPKVVDDKNAEVGEDINKELTDLMVNQDYSKFILKVKTGMKFESMGAIRKSTDDVKRKFIDAVKEMSEAK